MAGLGHHRSFRERRDLVRAGVPTWSHEKRVHVRALERERRLDRNPDEPDGSERELEDGAR